mmetsp:Transcript_45578/g.68764  ORF Transcript_45578/g.68764 Transcript_45578/m.68764 type:complete len:100 (-) Transcript_45578:790-1089(-)
MNAFRSRSLGIRRNGSISSLSSTSCISPSSVLFSKQRFKWFFMLSTSSSLDTMSRSNFMVSCALAQSPLSLQQVASVLHRCFFQNSDLNGFSCYRLHLP